MQDWKRHICIIAAKIHDTFANLPVKNPPTFRKCLERSYNTTFGQQRGIMRCWKNNTKMYDMIFSPFFIQSQQFGANYLLYVIS